MYPCAVLWPCHSDRQRLGASGAGAWCLSPHRRSLPVKETPAHVIRIKNWFLVFIFHRTRIAFALFQLSNKLIIQGSMIDWVLRCSTHSIECLSYPSYSVKRNNMITVSKTSPLVSLSMCWAEYLLCSLFSLMSPHFPCPVVFTVAPIVCITLPHLLGYWQIGVCKWTVDLGRCWITWVILVSFGACIVVSYKMKSAPIPWMYSQGLWSELTTRKAYFST